MAAAPPLQTRQRPAATGRWDRTSTSTPGHRSTSASPLQLLLPRLEGVLKTGGGYRACCPNCGGQSRKLALAEGDNGTILLTCFSCHDTGAVLAAIGMVMGDLFVRRDLRTLSHAERSQLRQAALLPRWKAAMDVLVHEAGIALVAGNQLADGIPLSEDDLTRLQVAALRIFDAQEALRAR